MSAAFGLQQPGPDGEIEGPRACCDALWPDAGKLDQAQFSKRSRATRRFEREYPGIRLGSCPTPVFGRLGV